MTANEESLKVRLYGGQVQITIGIDALAYAVQASDTWDERVKIVDTFKFAKAFVHELNDENEIGETRVHLLFDNVAENVVNDDGGCEPDCIEFHE